MTIHQLASLSNDALSLSGLMLFTSQILLLSQQAKLQKRDLLYIIFLSLILVQAKPGYITFLLLLFIFPRKQFHSRREHLIFLAVAYLINIILFITLYKMVSFEKYIQKIHGVVQINPEKQIEFLTSNLTQYLTIFVHTLVQDGRNYVWEMLGVFGWLSLIFPPAFYLFIIISFVFILSINYEPLPLSFWQRGLMFGTFFLTFSAILTLDYILWSEPYSSIIKGQQGRYFITLFPLLILSFYQLEINKFIKEMVLFSMILILMRFQMLKMTLIMLVPISVVRIFNIKFNEKIKILFLIIIFLIIAVISIKGVYSYYDKYYYYNCLR